MGNYEILEELGRGAMGVVFKAKQISLDRTVALKFLPKRLAQNEKLVKRFLREARAAGQLAHPNLVAVYDVGQLEGLYYISMEYIDGASAHKRLKANGPFSETEALEIGLQIAAALKEAHGRGILHRDVKPDNFLLETSGRARLADLGLARMENESAGEEGHLTQDGAALGTPHYMSPEQAQGATADARSDLYGLGASLYALASGRTPFEGPTAALILVKVLKDDPLPLAQAAPQLSPGFLAVVEKLLRKDPAERFQSAQELLDALGQVKAGTYPAEAPAHSSPAARLSRAGGPRGSPHARAGSRSAQASPWLFVVLGSAAAALLLGLLTLVRPGTPESPAARPVPSTPRIPPSPPEALPSIPSQEAARRQAEADKSFQALEAQQSAQLAANPAALAEAWEGFLKTYPEAQQSEQARQKAQAARTAAENLQRDWDKVRASVEQAVADQKFRLAHTELADFRLRHAGAPQAEEARKMQLELRGQVLGRVKGRIGKALSNAEKGDFHSARRGLTEIQESLPAQLTEESGVSEAFRKVDQLETAQRNAAPAPDPGAASLWEVAFQKAVESCGFAKARWEETAKRALAEAQAAFERKDAAFVQRLIAPLLPGGGLSETACARAHAAEIQKLAQGEKRAPPAVVVDAAEALRKSGWEGLEGEWKSDPNRPGIFSVKNGKLRLNAKDAALKLSYQLSPGAKLGVYMRYKENPIKKSRLGPGPEQMAFLKDVGEGYGILAEGNSARVFGRKRIPGLPGGRPPPGKGGKAGRYMDRSAFLADLPLKVHDWDLPEGSHTLSLSVKGDVLELWLDGQSYREPDLGRDDGSVLVVIEGEAVLEKPQVKAP